MTCNHDILMAKYTEHRKVHEHFLRLFNNLLETTLGMQTLTSEVNSHFDEIQKLLLQTEGISSSPPSSPKKRRKAHSFDSPSTAAAVDRAVRKAVEDEARNKSESDVSSASVVLNQNIDLPDNSEDSFFALTQSPQTGTRLPLSPRKVDNCCSQEDNVQRTPPAPPKKSGWLKAELFGEKDDGGSTAECERKRKKGNLSLSRFNATYKMSPETSKQVEQLPIRQKMATPKPKGTTEQENWAPSSAGKWTVKKTTPGGSLGRPDSKTPTSCKKENSLLNRTRLRQTKLKFQDNLNKSMADEDETYFEEFVVPSPTSVTALSGSRFLKSAKKKEQSSLIENDDDVFTASKKQKSPSKVIAAPPPCDDDDFDIDQTYFSEAEKDLTRSKTFIRPAAAAKPKVKLEPLTQQKKPSNRPPILAPETQQDASPDSSSSSSVLFVKPQEDEIITIDETQPSKKDLFMEAIRAERSKDDPAPQSVLNVMATGKKQQHDHLFPTKSDLHLTASKKPPPTASHERRCLDCQKQYQFLLNRGLPPDVVRTKLPRNCRECRLAQLHDTPPGFWNPVFTPTQN